VAVGECPVGCRPAPDGCNDLRLQQRGNHGGHGLIDLQLVG
jgi:hypothetical protein